VLGRQTPQNDAGAEAFRLSADKGDSRVDEPKKDGIEEYRKKNAVYYDIALAQSGAQLASIKQSDVGPI
jgi:hypothetical protein